MDEGSEGGSKVLVNPMVNVVRREKVVGAFTLDPRRLHLNCSSPRAGGGIVPPSDEMKWRNNGLV